MVYDKLQESYVPVPVSAARRIADELGKSIVCIVSIDSEFRKTHFTSYGRNAQDKAYAASMVDAIASHLGHDLASRESFEDFRTESEGAVLIAAERARQVKSEGWSSEHDDAHAANSLAMAAACYASPFAVTYGVAEPDENGDGELCDLWPFDREWDKRAKHDRKKLLVIAGAMIAAELDRMIRAESRAEQHAR